MKKIFEKSEIILAIILLISFFLPWFNDWGNYSGLKVPLLLAEWPAPGIDSNPEFWIQMLRYLFFIVYLIPIFCAIIIIQWLRKKKTIGFSLATGIIIYLLLFYNLIVYPEYIYHQLLFGAWITLVAGLLLIFNSIFRIKYFKLNENCKIENS